MLVSCSRVVVARVSGPILKVLRPKLGVLRHVEGVETHFGGCVPQVMIERDSSVHSYLIV